MKKYSKQREIIRKALIENPVHPTADEIYTIVRRENPQISLGTVYRNLNLLAGEAAILKIPIPGHSDRFDGNPADHRHILCQDCGALFDMEFDPLSGCNEKIREETGIVVTGYHLIIHGICQNCQQKYKH